MENSNDQQLIPNIPQPEPTKYVEQTASTKPSSHKKQLYLFIAVVVVIVVASLLIFVVPDTLFIRFLQPKEGRGPSTAVKRDQPVKGIPEVDLTTCPVVKEGNPLVIDARNAPGDMQIGVIKGNIEHIEINGTFATMQLISVNGDQRATFPITEQEGLIYNARAQKDATIQDLKAGQTIDITFNCFLKKDKRFSIGQLAIVGQ